MSEISVLKQFYRFNRKVRKNYLSTLMKLNTEEQTRDRGASYPSMLDIFDHVLNAYDFWFVQILGERQEDTSVNEDDTKTVGAVTKHERATGDIVLEYTESLTEKDLDREVTFSDGSTPARLGDICWHMVEEELQHRCELNALMWQMDIDPPIGTYGQWIESIEEPE